MEGLPTSVGAFKDHPIYALERHLRKDQAIHPRTEIAHFRGEPVFPRQNVLTLKPADGWMRQGRRLREGMQPIKMAKPRASTIRKKRELELRREEEGEVMVGMYAEWQTEVYRPPPVVEVSMYAWFAWRLLDTTFTGENTNKRLWKYRFVRAVDAP